MTHEFIQIVQGYKKAKKAGRKSILVTLVALDGSSYRPSGVRMLVVDDASMIGVISGGCVEKEILKQTGSVFTSKVSKIMTYDGRYRLGCEGLLYILLEPFGPSDLFLKEFENNILKEESFQLKTYFKKEVGTNTEWGTEVVFTDNSRYYMKQNRTMVLGSDSDVLVKEMNPCFKLVIFGAERDAAQLCIFAKLLGWKVTVVVSISNPLTLQHFPGANEIFHVEPESIETIHLNKNSAVILMTHSYARDLKYLSKLKEFSVSYIGLLGPKKRREKLLNEFIELHSVIEDSFFDLIHGPSGLNIGAETPQEIALSICSEILSVVRGKEPIFLSDKVNAIHCEIS